MRTEAVWVPGEVAEVAAAYGTLPGVIAVAVAGSQIAGTADVGSDVDLYVYALELPPLSERATLAAHFATMSEIGNAFWEPGDEWIDARTGLHVDVMYRSPAWIEDQLARVLVRHEASLGYSTSVWHNVLHSEPLIDRDGWYGRLQDHARRPYPEPLRRAIVARNHPVLRGTHSSYRWQIAQAVRRGDVISVQHRVTALLASYFDVLFALNEIPHPGEKRLLQFAIECCPKLPPDAEGHLSALLALPAAPTTDAIVRADALLDGLDTLLQAEGLLLPATNNAGKKREETWPSKSRSRH